MVACIFVFLSVTSVHHACESGLERHVPLLYFRHTCCIFDVAPQWTNACTRGRRIGVSCGLSEAATKMTINTALPPVPTIFSVLHQAEKLPVCAVLNLFGNYS